MDVIYTDTNRTDQGIIQGFQIDFDTTKTMDYELAVGIENNIMTGGCYWYIDGTEYGGVVDSMTIITESSELRYTGSSFRGILSKKIISPPAGEDYKTVSGNITDVVGSLLEEAALKDLFTAGLCNITVSSYRFKRYISLYEGLTDLAYQYNKVLSLECRSGKKENERRLDRVVISFIDRIDYSDEKEYGNNDLQFRITKGYSTVNHLICLGQGELKDRTVVHLYADAGGDISDKQYFFGADVIEEVYENTGAASAEELRESGEKRFKELLDMDSFEVTVPDDITLKIGDIIGGYEKITGFYAKTSITNVVVRINDNGMDTSYEVGKVSASSRSNSGGSGESSAGSSSYVLPISDKDTLGGVKIGDGIDRKEDGTISVPIASGQKTGMVKIGDGLEIEADGTLNAKQTQITVDAELSDKSKNPVQNKAVKAKFDDMDTRKQDALTAGENIILENNVISADPNIYIGNIPTNYSTEEKTIGTWTDGKPLYQKTILLNSIVFGSYQYIQLDSAVEAKRIEGVIYRTNNRADNLDNYGVDDYYKHSISVRPSGIEYNISSIYADGWKSMMITIQYTKTSDSATTVPVGDASYYTTDERIVGRWIDGKPLYQKTLVLNSEKEIGNTWDWTSIGVSAGDIDFYISAKAYNSDGTFWNVNAATISGYIAIQTERNVDTITVKYITIQYTKTTD